jgi:hypothetical protein
MTPDHMLVRLLEKSMQYEAGVLSDSFWTYPEVVHVLPAYRPAARARASTPSWLGLASFS